MPLSHRRFAIRSRPDEYICSHGSFWRNCHSVSPAPDGSGLFSSRRSPSYSAVAADWPMPGPGGRRIFTVCFSVACIARNMCAAVWRPYVIWSPWGSCLKPKPDYALWLSGLGSSRHIEPTHPQVSTVRGLRLCGGFGNYLCRRSGLGDDAQASVKCWHEPKDGGNHGRLSDPLGLLWLVDSFATGDRMERGRSVDQFPKRRCVRSFRP